MASNDPVATAATATERVGSSRPEVIAAAAARLGAHASQLAILLDFDGTLAPIVDDPAAAAPDPAAASAARTLATRVALLACVTGRPALQARGLLGVDTIAYTGLHGAEVLQPGAAAPEVPEAFAADGAAVAAIIAQARAEPQGLAGLDLEEKGPIVALHWRRAVDPLAAQARAEELADRAVAAGLRSGTGRAVLELRPALELTKGDGVQALLSTAPEVRHAVFAGDDVTDLDAFARLRALVADGTLEGATLIAVAGADAPPQVADAADLVLSTPADLGAFLTDVVSHASAATRPPKGA
ncbi:MAG: trehalose-phosphatase [Solirubrobacteraceae bacterium]|nr:trehalose-phosphatase [Solirubrobacteraceae bacterium]